MPQVYSGQLPPTEWLVVIHLDGIELNKQYLYGLLIKEGTSEIEVTRDKEEGLVFDDKIDASAIALMLNIVTKTTQFTVEEY